jgi:hypothetical protein
MNANVNLSGDGPPPKPTELVDEYIRLRDAKAAAKVTMEEFLMANFTKRMNEIESALLYQLQTLGVDSMKTESGTFFKRVEVSVTVADGAAFQRHVIGTQQWELIDFRANKTAVKAFVEEHEGALPPGVNYAPTTVLSVRKPA